MNEENGWDPYVDGDTIEGPIDCVGSHEVVKVLTQ